MAVDVGISHMTLLIVTLAFSLINICLIIASGGIIYNWQDRFVGPVMSCNQPKWTSDGTQNGRTSYGNYYNNYRSSWTNTNTNTWNTWNTQPVAAWTAQPVAAWTAWVAQPVVAWTAPVAQPMAWTASVNTAWTNTNNWNSWGNNNVNTYQYVASNIGGVAAAIGSASWASWNGNAWSTCPIFNFPMWSQWTQPVQQTQTWTTWSQPTAWVAWSAPTVVVSQPTVWVAWTAPSVVVGK